MKEQRAVSTFSCKEFVTYAVQGITRISVVDCMHLLISLLLFPFALFAGEPLFLCGGAECFVIDSGEEKPVKTWSWRAKDHPELPAELIKTFGTTTDGKLIDEGKSLLISSSGGGCALIDYPAGQVRWSARVGNAHSIAALPGGRIIVAGSLGANKLVLFDRTKGAQILWETACHSAHGMVWDEKRQRLYALGFNELRLYQLQNWSGEQPALSLESTLPLPDPDGHDISIVPTGNDLAISTESHVWLFDRETRQFRPHPIWKDHVDVKSIDIHPTTLRPVMVQARNGHWWSDTLHFLQPSDERKLPGETIYKARWLICR